ncbi:MAG: hypothetical protein QNJ97_18395 [Myxococcota bacterium]|nr:hypothetical protein [Myxococcota bacterium]
MRRFLYAMLMPGATWWIACLLGLLLTVLGPVRSRAWSVATGSTDPCHEGFTGRAYKNGALTLPDPPAALPSDNTWRKLADYLIEVTGVDPDTLDETERFVLVSLVVGARAPDTDGHSLFDLESLRKVHADPSAVGQYSHSLRGPDDDFSQGDAAAVTGTRQVIIELMDAAETYLSKAAEDQIIKTTVYLDFYGLVDLHVWAPVFHIGVAAHVVQDTFSHTIRTAADGFKRIAHVMNYIDAISSNMNPSRDGLAHSETFDDCLEPDLAPIVASADQATVAFFQAVTTQLEGTDPNGMLGFLDTWITLKQDCTEQNDYCDNAPWVAIARREQTASYLSEIFSCSSVAPAQSPVSPISMLISMVFAP